jgi:hypothetical protein
VTSTISSPRDLHRSPRTTGFSPLTARSSVDLPEPDSPISTRDLALGHVSEQSCTPSTWPVAAWISARLCPCIHQRQRGSGASPKTMETLSKVDGAHFGSPAASGRA